MSPLGDRRDLSEAAHGLAALNAQGDVMRAELAGLRNDLAQAQRDFSAARTTQLQEANEHLVLAALQAHAAADATTAQLDYLARSNQRDALTDTPNRDVMLDRLDNAIAMARRRGTRMALLFVDLDHFKYINDTHGHAAGDEVLQLVARRMEWTVRDSDTVSRYGGDEFLVLLPEVMQASDAALIAEKMLVALTEPYFVGNRVLRLSASAGICMYPDHAVDAANLIARADAAMYRAKRRGHGSFEFHAAQPGNEPDSTLPAERESRDEAALHSDAHLRDLRDLREANEQLLLSALTAQDLEAHVATVHGQLIQFLAMVAHELRNPLGPIRNAAELLKRSSGDARHAQLHSVIERQVAHMSRLVDDLLDGSRAATGKFRLERGTVDLLETLTLAAETCRPSMQAKHQHLRVLLPPVPIWLHGDAVRLLQVFSNLLDNASKYTPAGGEVELSATHQAQTVSVTVSDNGVGLTPQALLHVFDLFAQDERSLTVENRGLGIGLAVVRELVEGHGGSVIGSSGGRDLGSEFVVTLPRIESAEPAN